MWTFWNSHRKSRHDMLRGRRAIALVKHLSSDHLLLLTVTSVVPLVVVPIRLMSLLTALPFFLSRGSFLSGSELGSSTVASLFRFTPLGVAWSLAGLAMLGRKSLALGVCMFVDWRLM
jgi:hypothetical protein